MTYYQRHLPHWYPPETDIFITWRLHGSLPAHARNSTLTKSSGKQFLNYDRALDVASTGPVWLKDSRIAECVIAALQKGQNENKFRVHTYAVMFNHVHVLLAPLSSVAQITQQIKGKTAREANLILGRTGAKFWQDESFDHWIRNPEEARRVRTYIEQNPVSAGLVSQPKDWPWSSASNPIE